MEPTKIYFIRHAEPDRTVRDGSIRPLTERGAADARKLVPLFEGVAIDRIFSSPLKRAADTVLPLAENRGLSVTLVDDFKERRSDSVQSIPMNELIRKQWEDFSYTLSDGECFGEVRDRNILALKSVLEKERGRSVVIGTHGVALCTILSHYFPDLGIARVEEILLKSPFIVRMVFSGDMLIEMNEIDFL